MPSITAVLFDKDGTLFDFQSTWSAWAVRAIAELGGGDPGREDALAAAMDFDLSAGRFRPGSIVIASPSSVTADHVHAVVGGDRRKLGATLDRIAEDTPQAIVAGAGDVLDRLSRDYALGVVTNDNEGVARRHLADAGVIDHFGFIVGADSGHGAKPAPGQLQAFLHATGHAPRSTVMVGDSTHDLHAARAAEMHAVAVLTGVATEDDLAPHADVVLPDITHLPDWIGTVRE